MRRITFVTRNRSKLAEAQAALGPLGYDVVQDARGYPEVQEDTLEEVAAYGVERLQDVVAPPFFLEDAGLFVDALGGFPGVYSAYVYKTIGNEGLLRLLAPATDRRARFEAVIGHHDGAAARFFHGVCQGRITDRERGTGGFGFDPVFVPDGSDRTFGEMGIEEKQPLSHRGRALDQMVRSLRSDQKEK